MRYAKRSGPEPCTGELRRWYGIPRKLRLAAFRNSQKVVFFIAKFNKPDMALLRELLETGKVGPVIARKYELGEIADALRHMGKTA